jgi:hypothetical protein
MASATLFLTGGVAVVLFLMMRTIQKRKGVKIELIQETIPPD